MHGVLYTAPIANAPHPHIYLWDKDLKMNSHIFGGRSFFFLLSTSNSPSVSFASLIVYALRFIHKPEPHPTTPNIHLCDRDL
jgi:hypothetical protein